MLRDPIEQPPTEDFSSPLSAQFFELCDPDLLRGALESPEENSSPNYFYEENSPYPSNLPYDPNLNSLPNSPMEKYGTTTITNMPPTSITTATTSTNINNNHLSVLFESPEEIENDISASIDFSTSIPFSLLPYLVNQQDQFDISTMQSQNGFSHFPSDHIPSLMGTHHLPSSFDNECLSIMPSYPVCLNASSATSSSFLEPNTGSYLPSNLSTSFCAADNSRIFNGNLYMGNEMDIQELEFQGDNGGIFCPDMIFHSGDLQALSNESQHIMNGAGSSTPLASEVSSLEDSAFKGTTKLSAEEKKERIHRYMKKRSERNFSKKIKYACRKTLADSRPRVRGRFAKNDELGEMYSRGGCNNHEEDTDEDSVRAVVKEEEEMIGSSDIFSHISGVNSFKYSYPIQSWI